MQLPRVWAEIDLDAIDQNLAACRAVLSSRTDVLGVVKADAYGHGSIPVAETLAASGVRMLGVGDSHEAIQLRESGILTPILVLGAVVDGEIPELVRHDITPTIHSPERIDAFERYAQRMGVQLRLHLLVDTGMSLLGVTPATALDSIRRLQRSTTLQLAGVGTHFASPDDPDFTARQLARLERLVLAARRRGLPVPLVHACASQTLESRPDAHFDLVRLGGALYGLRRLGRIGPTTRPALSLHSQIVHLRDLEAGSPVSYEGTFVTQRRTRLATLAVGYHDGYSQTLSNRAHVLVRGARAPVIGRVTMDYTLIDVTEIGEVQVGDRATLLGKSGARHITADDLAEWAGTVTYEIPSHLGPRVQRVYLRSGRPAERSDSLTTRRMRAEETSRVERH